MALELDDISATILDVNPRKEGAGDDKVLACDIKLRIDMEARDVLPYFHPDLNHFLFHDSGCRFPPLGAFKWDCAMEHMEIDASGYTFWDARLSKFSIEPRYGAPADVDKHAEDDENEDGRQPGLGLGDNAQAPVEPPPVLSPRVTLTFTASVHPEGSEIAGLSELLQEQVQISIRPRQAALPV